MVNLFQNSHQEDKSRNVLTMVVLMKTEALFLEAVPGKITDA
jgi:hypothetical protein